MKIFVFNRYSYIFQICWSDELAIKRRIAQDNKIIREKLGTCANSIFFIEK